MSPECNRWVQQPPVPSPATKSFTCRLFLASRADGTPATSFSHASAAGAAAVHCGRRSFAANGCTQHE